MSIREQVLARARMADSTEFELANETTLQGAARITESRKYQHIGVLNFASARHPGGGFLGGAKAQEEKSRAKLGFVPQPAPLPGLLFLPSRIEDMPILGSDDFQPGLPGSAHRSGGVA